MYKTALVLLYYFVHVEPETHTFTVSDAVHMQHVLYSISVGDGMRHVDIRGSAGVLITVKHTRRKQTEFFRFCFYRYFIRVACVYHTITNSIHLITVINDSFIYYILRRTRNAVRIFRPYTYGEGVSHVHVWQLDMTVYVVRRSITTVAFNTDITSGIYDLYTCYEPWPTFDRKPIDRNILENVYANISYMLWMPTWPWKVILSIHIGNNFWKTPLCEATYMITRLTLHALHNKPW